MTFAARLGRLCSVEEGEDLEVAVELGEEGESHEPLVEDRDELLMSREHHRFSVAVPSSLGGSRNSRQRQVETRRNGAENCSFVAERAWSPNE